MGHAGKTGNIGGNKIAFQEGNKVKWKWDNGIGEGKVVKKYTQKITKKINGTEITRDADDYNPAYLIEQEDGNQVLKFQSEVDKA